MKRKSFWRRINRGFVVSMALLAAVLIYVLVTQLLLIPQKQQLTELARQAADAIVGTEVLTSPVGPETQPKAEYLRKVTEALEPLFAEDSDYAASAAQQAAEMMFDSSVIGGGEIRSTRLTVEKVRSCSIEEDVASLSLESTYEIAGKLYDPYTDTVKETEKGQQILYLSLSLKKTDGQWEIYRISSVGSYTNTGD